MQLTEWRFDAAVDPKRFSEAKLQLLSAAQWLARIERSFDQAQDEGKLALYWGNNGDVISTKRFEDNLGVEMSIGNLTMQFTEDGKPSDHMIDIEDRSPAHVEAWILVELLHRGVDRQKFSKDLPYDTSELMNGDASEFSPMEYEAELRQLSHWYRNAVSALKTAATRISSRREELPILIAPQNLRLEMTVGDRVLGFSSGDRNRLDPYFFVAQGDRDFKTSAEIVKVLEVSNDTTMDQVEEFLTTAPVQSTH